MYIPFEAVTITPLKHNRKILSRFLLQNQMFCVCRLPAVYMLYHRFVIIKKEDVVWLPMRQLSTRDQNDTDINNYRSAYDLQQ